MLVLLGILGCQECVDEGVPGCEGCGGSPGTAGAQTDTTAMAGRQWDVWCASAVTWRIDGAAVEIATGDADPERRVTIRASLTTDGMSISDALAEEALPVDVVIGQEPGSGGEAHVTSTNGYYSSSDGRPGTLQLIAYDGEQLAGAFEFCTWPEDGPGVCFFDGSFEAIP